MNHFGYEEHPQWKEILQQLSDIRDRSAYEPDEVDFIRENLNSGDDRIRGGAALAAEGCLFEKHITDLLLQIVESDPNDAVRKAAIQSLQGIIHEGVLQGFESETGADSTMDEVEEWGEYQEESLKEDYLRVKFMLLEFLENDFLDTGLREAALASLADLGFLPAIQERIRDFISAPGKSSKVVALHAMGKFPHFWENELEQYITPQTDKSLLMEAISASYSSDSARLATCIEQVLKHPDPDVIIYAMMTLANINRTENLGEILQRFSLHPDPRVQEAAKEAIELFSKKSFNNYMQDNLGFEE